MMKKKGFSAIQFVLVLLLTFVIGFPSSAQTISPGKAATIAQNWLKARMEPSEKIAIQEVIEDSGFYIVTFHPAGFVLVPFAPSEYPVLGFSLESTFPSDPHHPIHDFLLPALTESLKSATSRNSDEPLKGGSSLKTDLEISPLIHANWGQGSPWNKYCPADTNGNHAQVGCVAVAMAQIMYTWQWPETGEGSNAFIPSDHREYGTVSAQFDTTHYHWENMQPLNPTDAAALILFHTGVSIFMNYGPSESGSNTASFAVSAFKNNFRYKTSLNFREREEHSYNDWTNMLRQELINGRPILYNGTNPTSKVGHAFNIDGFHDSDFFHFNWGWSGAGNGYFLLDPMGGGSADFSLNQGAIFGIQPNNLPQHDRPAAFTALAGDSMVQIFWTPPIATDLSHYTIYRNGEAIDDTWQTSYRDDSVQNGVEYTYYLTATYVGETPGESKATPSIEVTPWPKINLPYQQDFESGSMGWQMNNTDQGFRVDEASSSGFGGNASHIAFIRSESVGDGIRVSDYLTSPVIYPGAYEKVAISFDYLFHQKEGVDYFYLMYHRFTDGLWIPIAKLTSTGSYSDWERYMIYLPDEAGNGPVQIGFFYNNFYQSGFGAAIDNFSLFEVQDPPVPGFSVDFTDICQDQNITVYDQSTGQISHWLWDFGEGAEPRYSESRGNQTVRYTTPGNKTIHLVLNHLDHLDQKDLVQVRPHPVSEFTYVRNRLEISFTSTASYAESVFWDFGDGDTSTQVNPVHTYNLKDIFPIRHIVYNGTCEPDTSTQWIDFRNGTGMDDPLELNPFTIYPNPVQDKLFIDFTDSNQRAQDLRIFNSNGSLMQTIVIDSKPTIEVNFSAFPQGIYILQLIYGQSTFHQRILKTNRPK